MRKSTTTSSLESTDDIGTHALTADLQVNSLFEFDLDELIGKFDCSEYMTHGSEKHNLTTWLKFQDLLNNDWILLDPCVGDTYKDLEAQGTRWGWNLLHYIAAASNVTPKLISTYLDLRQEAGIEVDIFERNPLHILVM